MARNIPISHPGDRVGPLAAEIGGFLDIIDGLQDADSSPQFAAHCLGSVALAETVRERLIESEANAVASRLAEGRVDPRPRRLRPGSSIILFHYWQGRGDVSRAQTGRRLAQIVEAFQLAVDQELSCVPDLSQASAPQATMSIIKQSRFFALVTKHLLNEP